MPSKFHYEDTKLSKSVQVHATEDDLCVCTYVWRRRCVGVTLRALSMRLCLCMYVCQ